MPHVILLYCVFYAQRHKNSFPIKPTMCVGISLDKLLKAFFHLMTEIYNKEALNHD